MLARLDTTPTNRAVIGIDGDDATDFLHAQLTSDVLALNPGSAQWTAWCTPKGRVVSAMLLARVDTQDFRLVVPADIAEDVARRLGMYVLRAKVKVSLLDVPVFAAWGELPPSLAESRSAPTAMDCWRYAEQLVIALDDANGEPTRRLILGEPASTPDASAQAWHLEEILAAEPVFDRDLSEQFIPQSLNLDALGGVSFEKGCYPGQEIVARTFFLGRLKHRLAIARGDLDEPPVPGTRLGTSADDDRAGSVLTAVRDGNEVVMTVVTSAERLEGTLYVPDAGEIVVSKPPYALPAAKRESKNDQAE